ELSGEHREDTPVPCPRQAAETAAAPGRHDHARRRRRWPMSAAMRHEESWLLLPWLANGRLSQAERARVEEHVHGCTECATELAQQRLMCEVLTEPDRVTYAPGPSFRKLMERIDARPAAAPERRAARVHGFPAPALSASRPPSPRPTTGRSRYTRRAATCAPPRLPRACCTLPSCLRCPWARRRSCCVRPERAWSKGRTRAASSGWPRRAARRPMPVSCAHWRSACMRIRACCG